ncbi:hypothetical protein CLD22_28375, partial [Rubrivivax gelatinosus]|nr:hypothetical protein [Rubrivivax gelatinosus]
MLAIALALATTPALAGALIAGLAGVMLVASAGALALPLSEHVAPAVQVVRLVMPPTVRVFELAD